MVCKYLINRYQTLSNKIGVRMQDTIDLKAFGELLKAKDLVDSGVFKSTNAVAIARREGRGPNYIKLGSRSFLYPRNEVLKWLSKNTVNNN